MVQLLKDVFAVEVPEGRDFDFRIDSNNEYETDKFCTVGMLSKNKSAHRFVEIPYGSYEILFTTKDCTEDQAAGVVERDRGGFAGNIEGYKEYFKPGDWAMDNEPFGTALASLESLLRSKNLDPAKNHLLIRKL